MGETSSPGGESESSRPPDIREGMMETGFDTRGKTWTHEDRPDLIFRDAKTLAAGEGQSIERSERFETYTRALWKLDEYGIHTPGIGNARQLGEEKPGGFRWETVYTATQRVDGKNMYLNITEIPAPVILKTIDAMLRYYEDMLEDSSRAAYLTDLGLANLLYGRAPGDSSASVYFVDLELGHMTAEKHMIHFMPAMRKLDLDIKLVERVYGQDFDSYQQRLEAITKRLRGE